MKKHFLNEPDIYQKEAINHCFGPCLVLAGPGCGKTTVITHHINFLVKHLNINPEQILVITFTKMAALEMQERYLKLIGTKKSLVNFGTCHSVFFHILKCLTPHISYEIISDKENLYLRNQLIQETYNLNKSDYDINNWFSEVNEEEKNNINKRLIHFKKANGKITYDDILYFTYDYLKNNETMQSFWRNKYQHILIDEFQDTNLIQYNIIRLLTNAEKNIFAVGDDDQSIYSFRGAEPKVVNMFIDDYNPVSIIKLKYNYRSCSVITEHAMHLISNNRDRVSKELVSYNKTAGQITCFDFINSTEMYEKITSVIQEEKIYRPPEDICILVRTNIQLKKVSRYLMSENIKYICHEKHNDILGHFIVDDLLAYMNLANVGYTRNDFYKTMNKPNRSISRSCITESTVSFDDIEHYYINQPQIYMNVKKYKHLISMIKEMEPYAAIIYIRKYGAYDKYVEEYSLKNGSDISELYEILNGFTNFAKHYATYDDLLVGINKFVNKTPPNSEKGSIKLMSYHAAKGLEFPVVIMPELIEGIVPHKRNANIEEERRLFYVAVTRAKQKLYLLSYNTSGKKQFVRSRFIDELKLEDHKSSKSKSSRYSS